MPRAVGLDIGSRTIKVVEVSGTAKSFKVHRVAIRDIPPPRPPTEEDAPPVPPELIAGNVVKEIFEELKLPKDDVCASFAAGESMIREITVPFTEDDQIRKVVKFEAENHLHSHSVEDVVVNWIKTGQARDGSRLVVFASPKELLAAAVGTIRGAGIEPSSMDLDATAVFTAYAGAGVFEEHPNVVLIDVGARSTTLMLVTDGKPQTIRSFRLGIDHVVSRASRELGMNAEEVRRKVTLPEGPRPDDLLASVSSLAPAGEDEKSLARIEGEALADESLQFVQKLHREAMRSLASVREDASPDRILLSGGGSLMTGLAQSFEERFGLPVERVDLAKHLDWKARVEDAEREQALTPAAVGCGMRMLGYDPLGVELLQDEFAPTNRFDVVKNALATSVTLLFLVLLSLAFVAVKKRNAETHRNTYVVSRAEALYTAAEKAYLTKVEAKTEDEAQAIIQRKLANAPRDYTRAAWLRSQLLGRYRKLQNELGLRRDIPEIPSAVKVWLEVYRALNKRERGEFGGHFRILKMDIRPRSATVTIEVDDQGVFDVVRQQFEASEYFKERARTARVVEQGATKFVGGHWQSTFDFRFKEEE